jgi:hypothetical protein
LAQVNIAEQKVESGRIATGAVTGDKIGVGAVSSNHIADLAVTGNELGLNSVSANNIANGSISSVKLAEPNAFEDYFLLGSL